MRVWEPVASNSQSDRLAAIEQTQASLRDSIEQSRKFAEQSQQMIQKHREALDGESQAQEQQTRN